MRESRQAAEREYWCELATPVGTLLLAGGAAALTRVHFQSGPKPLRPWAQWHHDSAPFARVIEQLNEYFTAGRREFDLPLAPAGTNFQLRVWQALRSIPYGETRSYSQLAQQLGQGGARAVGLANGANPLPIIIPCHRVIGADGSLTGFGGGLGIKHSLLCLEGAACVADLFSAPSASSPGAHAGRAAGR